MECSRLETLWGGDSKRKCLALGQMVSRQTLVSQSALFLGCFLSVYSPADVFSSLASKPCVASLEVLIQHACLLSQLIKSSGDTRLGLARRASCLCLQASGWSLLAMWVRHSLFPDLIAHGVWIPGSACYSRKTHGKHLEGILIMSNDFGVKRQEIKYFGSSSRKKVLRNLGFWDIQAQCCM